MKTPGNAPVITSRFVYEDNIISLIQKHTTLDTIESIVYSDGVNDKDVQPNHIRFIAFKSLEALYRRTTGKLNPLTNKLDCVESIKDAPVGEWLNVLFDEYQRQEFNPKTQIIVCIGVGPLMHFNPILRMPMITRFH
jgi:hypothetical protein